jgi:hypothetical protein
VLLERIRAELADQAKTQPAAPKRTMSEANAYV